MFIYNIGIFLYGLIISIVQRWNSKAKLWIEGRKDIFERMHDKIKLADGENLIWIHVASLGEFEQGRPIIETIKQDHPTSPILLTFFSPSGYEIRKDYQGVDYIFYLPLDTPSNVKRFLDVARPQKAIFVKYEYWLNMLFELHRRSIDTYVVSANFRANSIFFKPWGALHRKALATFKTIFVQSESSKKLLRTIGVERVVVAGDTRFDRVVEIARTLTPIEKIEAFAQGEKIFVAGSAWEPDIEIIAPLIKEYKELKFLLVPHEVDSAHMHKITEILTAQGVDYSLYSNFDPTENSQVLIVDSIGILSKAYQYARCAYVGGGFGVGIHNTLEPAVYGIPISFGDNYGKFKEAIDLIDRGIARSVST